MKKLLTLLLFFVVQLANGQDPYYYVVDKTKGLPSNSVYDIYQDKKGYMWFATDEGLCRYNGTTFKSYFSDEQTSKAGSSIAEDKYGRVWYSNFDGYLYYVQNGKLKALNNKNPIGYFNYGITDKYLYQVTKRGVAVYNLETLKLQSYVDINETQLSSTSAVKNKYYVLTTHLYEIEQGKKTRKIVLPPNFHSYLGLSIIMQPTEQGLLFLSKLINHNYLMLPNGKFVKQQRPHHLNFVQNTSYTDNNIWFATPKGIYKNLEDGSYKAYFKAFNISSTFKDNSGSYWFSTLNRGLLLVPNLKNMLLEIQPRPIKINAVKDGVIASTENEHIYRLNLNNYTNKLLYKGESNHSVDQLFNDFIGGEIMFTSNKFIMLDDKGGVKKQVHVAIKDIKKVDDSYFSFAASGYSGLFKLKNSGRASIWDSLYRQERPKSPDNFNEIPLFREVNGKATAYNSQSKTLYYATNVGLFYHSQITKGEIKYKNNSLYLKSLEAYKSKNYGLATNGKLYVVDSLNHTSILQLNKEKEPFVISKIKLIGKSLFLITRSAVYEYSLDKNVIIDEINLGNAFEVSDMIQFNGQLVFATAKGILLQSNQQPQKHGYTSLVIEDVLVNDSLSSKNQLKKLKYWQNNVEIKYAVLAYAPSEKFSAFYRVNDNKWVPLEKNSGSLKLSSLSAGEYDVDFKLVTKTEQFQKISFVIAPPFWLSRFFLAGVTFLLLLVVYLIYRRQIIQNNKRNQQKLDRISLENSLNQSKLKAIKSQMNPHFFYNALNTIQSYILSNDKKQAVSYLSKFANLTRTILEMSEKEEVALAEEIKTIGFYLDIEKARFNGDFDYTIAEIGIDSREDLRIPSMLLQPYLENAIKHGLLHKEGVKQLQVIFKKEVNKLTISIDDNGIGRKKSMELNEIKQLKHKSFATDAMQNRIDLLNKNKQHKITVSYIDKIGLNQQGIGTMVIIELPLT